MDSEYTNQLLPSCSGPWFQLVSRDGTILSFSGCLGVEVGVAIQAEPTLILGRIVK